MAWKPPSTQRAPSPRGWTWILSKRCKHVFRQQSLPPASVLQWDGYRNRQCNRKWSLGLHTKRNPRAPMTRVAKQVTMYHTVMIFPKIISKSGRARVNTSELRRSTTIVYRTDRQALSTARFCRTGQLATADTWFRTCRTSLVSALLRNNWQDFN